MAPRGSASTRSCRRDAGASSLDDMTSRGRAARSRTPCRVIHDRRQTTTVAVDPVNSPALPGWVQSVHASHQVILVGGVASCLRCGGIAASALGCATSMLKKPCRGFVPQNGGHVSRLQQLSQGRLPQQLTEWPDALATPRDARPVDHLRHTGSDWVPDSQVNVGVFTQRGQWRKSPARPRRRVSWDPYSPPHVEG